MIKHYYRIFPAFVFVGVLTACYCVYMPGVKGGFLFDDYPNLQDMGDYGGVRDWETFKSFVFNGYSGALGRPIALASFLLDDNSWPSSPESFKLTNIKIHLLCGIFLCWLVLHLMRLFGKDEQTAIWIALLCSSVWLLHPFLLSTALYVVQRMAQLETLFVFIGLTSYMYGRLLLKKNRQISAYVWMSGGLGLGTILAVFSKENGILLPLLAGVIELCLPSNRRPDTKWVIVFFGVPICAILYILLSSINFSSSPWSSRPFTQTERVLTESRIFWEYIYHLFIPQIEGRGLFQDGYVISKSLFAPTSTIVAISSAIILLVVGLRIRNRYPLYSIAILFFMVSHLIESTHLRLELYFEHRNYTGAGLLFLPMVALLVETKKIGLLTKVILASAVLLTLSFMTFQRAKLWSNSLELERFWAISAPDSPRAQNKLISIYLNKGKRGQAFALMEETVKKFPQSSIICVNYLLVKIIYNKADVQTFERVAELMMNQPFDAQSIVGLQNLVSAVIEHPEKERFIPYMIAFLKKLNTKPVLANRFQFQKIYSYSLAKLYLALEDYDKALEYFSKAVVVHRDMDAAMSMVALLGNADRPVEASMLLYVVEGLYKEPNKLLLKRSRVVYDSELIRIKSILDESLKNVGISELVIKKPKAE